MKTVIMCGGKGTRMSEYSAGTPKPMLEVGNKPILANIMDIYLIQGFNEFVLPVGYRKESILAYFIGLMSPKKFYGNGDFTDITLEYSDFIVHIVDTGLETQTGGRLARIRHYLTESFMLTYGDGLANVNLHRDEFLAENVITVVNPPSRFGTVEIMETGEISNFSEKPPESGYINGGFMLLSPEILEYIYSDSNNLEKDILPKFIQDHFVLANKHSGFWHCVDTKRDLDEINRIYEEEGAKWLRF